MAASPVNQPHLVSLVLQSKKALHHGEQLCTRAHVASSNSAQAAVDVLALDAKVRWVVEAVVEQLQLAANVAKTIEEKRAQIGKRVLEWDTDRTKHADALDDILESLGSQVVPPNFHQASSDSSLFGSQHSADLENAKENKLERQDSISPMISPKRYVHTNGSSGTIKYQARPSVSPVSPSATLRRNSIRRPGDSGLGNIPEGGLKGKAKQQETPGEGRKENRRRWKTLRDFVDDQAIEDILETIESDRSALDKILGKTDDYPETLTRTIQNIQASLPFPEDNELNALTRVQRTVTAQEQFVNSMATLLESLASHYDGMASALKDTEGGEVFSEEDIQSMNRDTEELPIIMKELEDNADAIDGYRDQLNASRIGLQNDLEHLRKILDDLDELGEIMGEMLQMQETVEIQVDDELKGLHGHLNPLKALHGHFVSYRTAFNKLLLEMDRRRQYREAAENIVIGMMKQLDSMTEEENRVRNHFNDEYGSSLPSDLCLGVSNAPTRWEIVPSEGSAAESLPLIASDLIVEARQKFGYSDGPIGAESL
ncbi:autophagy protein Apg17-domain-containing protein [Gymnopilus junonius]|uniref:Autophagy-related protein 17 n=1 Tax=Gymnopilus junonius TaxID=109634 RepID=A0A9P5NW43_GYMJU|nr:autophagy protein Apg17-domain-containing protein [Gymnopilus junonius]